MVRFDCPRCGDSDIVRRGKRYNASGEKQLYRCNKCRSAFVEPDGFERMRHSPAIIARAVHQHSDGFSLHKTKYHLEQHDDVKVSIQTISNWMKKYADFLKSANARRKAAASRAATS